MNGPGGVTWSPKGDRVVFTSSANGKHQVLVMDLQGTKAEQITSGEFNSHISRWSADGNAIYFGLDRTGGFEIWKTRLDSRETPQVTRNGGFYAEESPDENSFLTTRDKMATWSRIKPGIYSMPAAGGLEQLLLPDAGWFWRAGKAGIY